MVGSSRRELSRWPVAGLPPGRRLSRVAATDRRHQRSRNLPAIHAPLLLLMACLHARNLPRPHGAGAQTGAEADQLLWPSLPLGSLEKAPGSYPGRTSAGRLQRVYEREETPRYLLMVAPPILLGASKGSVQMLASRQEGEHHQLKAERPPK